MCTISYTHQTSGAWADVCACNRMHQMNKTESPEESGLSIKGVRETIKNEAKKQKGGFLGILLATLVASLSENLLTSKCTIRAGEGMIKAGQDF